MPARRAPHPGRRWLTLVVLSLGVSLIVVDGTIVNVSLPVIIRDLGLDLTDAQWVNTLYALVFAGLLITTGLLERHRVRVGRSALMHLGLFGWRSFRWDNVIGLVATLLLPRHGRTAKAGTQDPATMER